MGDFCNKSRLCGAALFLFGMTLMGEGLKRVAGSRLELILYRLSGTHLRGLLLGAGITGVIQSSAATSVMVVGFVNSGMMKFRQAISVILGALIGTSVTGWIIFLSGIEGERRANREFDRLDERFLEHGFLFNDLLTNLERVADHCSNIAIALIELHAHEYDTHTYVINLRELHSHNFDALYAEYSERYSI